MSIFAYPRQVPESEDCLVLDVYTPGINDRSRRPVMVWLHGGGFAQGSASAPVYDGTNLARRGDVVVVGVNHRLNVLGYTYLGELGGPDFTKSGNVGILGSCLSRLGCKDIAEIGRTLPGVGGRRLHLARNRKGSLRVLEALLESLNCQGLRWGAIPG